MNNQEVEYYLNNIQIESYLDLISEEILNEKAFFVSTKMKKILSDTPKVTKKEFIKRSQECDIITTFTPKKLIDKFTAVKITATIMASLQRSPYTTSKIVLNNNEVGGYGILPRETMAGSGLEIVPIKKAIGPRAELCLIRMPKVSDTKKKIIVKYIRKREGLDYARLDLYKTLWDRLTNRKMFSFMNDRSTDPKIIKKIFLPLICSTIISTIFFALDKIKFNGKNPYDVWPKDFVLDDRTEKICRVDYS